MKNRRRCTLNYTFARYYSVLRKIDSAGYARRPLRRNCWLRGNNVRNGILNSKSCSHNDNIICTRHRVFSPHTLYTYLLYIVCVYIYIYTAMRNKRPKARIPAVGNIHSRGSGGGTVVETSENVKNTEKLFLRVLIFTNEQVSSMRARLKKKKNNS